MSYDHDPEFLKLARQVLEGKAPPFAKKDDKKDTDKDEGKGKKDDDIEIDVKTSDGKTTKLHTKDGDGDGVAGDGTKSEKKVSAPKKEDGDDDGKISDGDSETKDDSKDAPLKKSEAKKDDSGEKAESPVKDDDQDDGAQEKDSGESDEDTGEKPAFGKDKDDDQEEGSDEDEETDGDGDLDKDSPTDGSDKNVTKDAVDGKNKTKIDLKPELKDEEPGEGQVTQTNSTTEAFVREARERRLFLKAVREVMEDCEKNHPEYIDVAHDGRGIITAKVMFEDAIEEVVVAEISMGEIKAAASKVKKKIASDYRDGVHKSVLSTAASMHSQQDTSGRVKARRERVYAKFGESVEVTEVSKELAGRYAKRANGENTAYSFFDGANSSKRNPDPEEFKKSRRKSQNRQVGIDRALRRLTREDVEQVDEISKKKLARYVSNASQDAVTRQHYKSDFGDRLDQKNHAERAHKIGKRLDGIKKASLKLAEKAELDESNAAKGHGTTSLAKKHEAAQAHHEELEAHHDNEGNADRAASHRDAAESHASAAYHYRRASHHYGIGMGSEAYRHVTKAERHASDAEFHEGEIKEEAISEVSSKKLGDYIEKASDARSHRKLSTKKVDNRYSGVSLAGRKIFGRSAKVRASEIKESTQDEKASDAKKSYEHHDKRADYHDKQLSNSSLDDDIASAHHKAMKAHQRAADAYSRAHQHFSKGYDSRGEEAMEKAERHAQNAEDHEAEHGL